MKLDLITRILEGIPGVRKDGGSYLIAEEADVSLYLGAPSELLTLPRVARITPSADLVIIETHKSERYFFAVDTVIGIKFGAGEAKTGGRGAGFR